MAKVIVSRVKGASWRLYGPGRRVGVVGRVVGMEWPLQVLASCWDIASVAARGPSGCVKECVICRCRGRVLIFEVALVKSRSSAL
jgi:hypothetical protein